MEEKIRTVGFIGLGAMGEPMALNLARAKAPLVVWNRTPAKLASLAQAGAAIAPSAAGLFASADVIILMLASEAAVDEVLDRAGPGFALRVRHKTLLVMGTHAPGWSRALEAEVRAAGGRYVEAPVSGSRKPAESGQLVAMLAGDADAVESVRGLLAPMCRDTVICGEVPKALSMKLAVNLFLISLVTGLAESVHFAAQHGLELDVLLAVLDKGPMASDVSRGKGKKLLARDFSAHASIADVLKNNRLIAEAAREAGIASPLLDACHALYGEALALGHGSEDMAAVIRALEARTDSQRG